MAVNHLARWMALSLCAAAMLPCRADPPPPARITMLEGDAVVIRGTSVAAAVVGLALKDGDIIESSANASIVRVELANEAMLDIGPVTRVLWHPDARLPGANRGGYAYLLSGWGKLSAAAGASGAVWLSPQIEALTNGVCVMQVLEHDTFAFADTDETRVTPRSAKEAATPSLPLKAGQFLSAARDAPPQVVQRPPAQWLQSVPLPLRDKLPSRIDRFADANVPLKALKEVSYTDVEHWLTAEAAIRSALLPRWKPRSRDPDFKAALIAHMPQHPEWDRVLFPQKYLPKPIPAPASGATSAPR